MRRALPGEQIPVSTGPLATGLTGQLGVQIRDADDLVVFARHTASVEEEPIASGFYTALVLTPPSQGNYRIIWDFKDGVIDADAVIEDLIVSKFETAEDAGVGEIAWAAKGYIPETYAALWRSNDYGPGEIQRRAEVVKRRVMTTSVAMADESMLGQAVIDYLGALVALEMIPAGIDYWASQPQSESTGQDPVEVTTYPDRIKALGEIQARLLAQTRRDEPLVTPLLAAPRLRAAGDGPGIDEATDDRVTADPRDFPTYGAFPRGSTRVIS